MKRKLLSLILVLAMALFGSANTVFAENDSNEVTDVDDVKAVVENDSNGDANELTDADDAKAAVENDSNGEANEPADRDGARAVRTIMLYACGADLESDEAMASYNLHQILDANFSTNESIRFIIMTGGAKQWRINEGEPGEDGKPAKLDLLCKADGTPIDEASNVYNQIWEAKGKDAAENPGKMVLLDDYGITGDEDNPVESKDELMSRPEILKAFIDYCVDNYPAEKYDLILWDHGGGPLQGFGVDEHNSADDDGEEPSLMSYGSLIDAISHNKVVDSDGDGAQDVDESGDPARFDFIDFDACLMNSVELNLGLADYMDYYIASPETEPGYGQQYTDWLNTLGTAPDKNAYELGKQIVNDFTAFYEAGYEDGSRQEGTLAVVDTQALMAEETGFVTALSEMNDLLKDEALASEFYDELYSAVGSIQYGDMDYFDLGNLVSQISIAIKEMSDTDEGTDDKNKYTEVAQTLNIILKDQSIIYAKGTSGIRAPGEWYRDDDGELMIADADLGTQMETSGMYIFFPSPNSNFAEDYFDAVTEALQFLPDDERADFLRSYMCTMVDYNIIMNMGRTVDQMIDEGMNKSEVSLNAIKEKLDVPYAPEYPDVTEWSSSYEIYMDIRDGVKDNRIENEEETLSWLDGLIKKQAADAVAKGNISVAKVAKKTGTGYKVTIKDIHKRAIENIKVNLVAEIPAAEEWIKENEVLNSYPEMREHLLGDDGGYVIGSANATAAMTLDDVKNYSEWYNSSTGSWNIEPIEPKTYAIKDAAGTLHVGEIEKGNSLLQLIATVPDSNGDGKEELVVLAFKDKVLSSILFLDPRKQVAPAQLKKDLEITPIHYLNFLGVLTFNIKLSEPFTLTSDNYKDIKLVYTDVSNIPDIADTTGDGQAVHNQFVVNDIYGHQQDFSVIAAASNEKLTDIDLARVKPVIYNGEEHIPEVICNGKSLVEDVDYKLIKASEDDVYKEADEYTLTLEGIGKYTGTKFTKFNIVQPEYIAELMVEQAQEEYRAAEEAYLAVLNSEDSDLAAIKAALIQLQNARTLLDTAEANLKHIQDILTAEEVAQMNDTIALLQEQVDELSDQVEDLEQQINNPDAMKKANPLNVKGRTAKIKYSELKKKNQTLALSKVIRTIKKGKGTITYKKESVSKKKYAKKFTISKTTGRMTVKKGVKKGTYTIKITVKASGNANYKAVTQLVTVKIKVI